MIDIFVKHFFILFTATYFFAKLLNIKTNAKIYFYNIITTIIFCSVTFITRMHFPHITTLLFFVSIYITVSLNYKTSSKITLTTSILSFGLSYFTFALSSLLSSTLFFFKSYMTVSSNVFFTLLVVLVGVVQLFFAFLIFRIKRLKKGMPFLLQKVPISVGIFISCTLLTLTSFATILDTSNSFYGFFIIICTVLTFILFIWWRKQLSVSYLNRAHKEEIKRLENELILLRKDNEHLGEIIHKDNKLIPAMIIAVQKVISMRNENTNEVKAIANSLLLELEELSLERSHLLKHQFNDISNITQSNIFRLDAVMNYMYNKAKTIGITLTISYDINVSDIISSSFSVDALVTIVADLIENAIIATNLSLEQKEILIKFANQNNIYCIDIYDTGIPFEVYTIENAGKNKASTHLDTGGSGIGLMTIFALLKKCNGSFVIDELLDNSQYKKKISIIFDSLGEYRVYSHNRTITRNL